MSDRPLHGLGGSGRESDHSAPVRASREGAEAGLEPEETSDTMLALRDQLDGLGRAVRQRAESSLSPAADAAPAFVRAVEQRRIDRLTTHYGLPGGAVVLAGAAVLLYFWLFSAPEPEHAAREKAKIDELLRERPVSDDTPVGWPSLKVIRDLNLNTKDDTLVLPVQEAERQGVSESEMLTPLSQPTDGP